MYSRTFCGFLPSNGSIRISLRLEILSLRDRRGRNQSQFLLSRQLFHGTLPPHGAAPIRKRFRINHRNGQTAHGIFCALAAIMHTQTPLRIVRITAVKSSVRTAQKIDVIHQTPAFSVPVCSDSGNFSLLSYPFFAKFVKQRPPKSKNFVVSHQKKHRRSKKHGQIPTIVFTERFS